MKKIVILGGGDNQIPLIKMAKEQGYYVVLCDFRDDVDGVALSDIHYQVNTLEYNEVANVCRLENPDGIISNSEPAMPIVAAISETFGFVGNSRESIQTLMSKNLFRSLQKQLGCFIPDYYEVSTENELWDAIDKSTYPIIIKPAQCSGSRGSRRIDNYDRERIAAVFSDCLHYTTNGKVIVEKFIEMPSLTTIEGDVFLHHGSILYDGIFSTTRAEWAPMVPMTYTAPAVINSVQRAKITDTLGKVFDAAGVVHGEYNIEGYFTANNEFFIIEVNVRQGGHEIPLLIRDFTGIDYSRLLVTTAVGDDTYWNEVVAGRFHTRNIIKQTAFSQYDGKYVGLSVDSKLKDRVYRIVECKQDGEAVQHCVDGTTLVAIVDMEFPSRKEQLDVYDKINKLVMVQTS
jgi:biotin carboxylase